MKNTHFPSSSYCIKPENAWSIENTVAFLYIPRGSLGFQPAPESLEVEYLCMEGWCKARAALDKKKDWKVGVQISAMMRVLTQFC